MRRTWSPSETSRCCAPSWSRARAGGAPRSPPRRCGRARPGPPAAAGGPRPGAGPSRSTARGRRTPLSESRRSRKAGSWRRTAVRAPPARFPSARASSGRSARSPDASAKVSWSEARSGVRRSGRRAPPPARRRSPRAPAGPGGPRLEGSQAADAVVARQLNRRSTMSWIRRRRGRNPIATTRSSWPFTRAHRRARRARS